MNDNSLDNDGYLLSAGGVGVVEQQESCGVSRGGLYLVGFDSHGVAGRYAVVFLDNFRKVSALMVSD